MPIANKIYLFYLYPAFILREEKGQGNGFLLARWIWRRSSKFVGQGKQHYDKQKRPGFLAAWLLGLPCWAASPAPSVAPPSTRGRHPFPAAAQGAEGSCRRSEGSGFRRPTHRSALLSTCSLGGRREPEHEQRRGGGAS